MTDLPPPDPERALAETRAWVERAVIGLNLCPFAKGVQVKGLVRYALTRATGADSLRAALVDELRHLAATPADEVETTVLVAPWAMAEFLEFNDFLAEADEAVAGLGLDGEIQLASFHPAYQFADADADDITHATNRAPWPTLHLIREDSIDRAVAAVPEADAIYEVNMATMRRLGPAGWAALRAMCRADAEADMADMAVIADEADVADAAGEAAAPPDPALSAPTRAARS
jgi:hypothetical protein